MANLPAKNLKFLALTMIAAFSLGACSSLPSIDGFSSSSVNFASGSPVAESLSGADKNALSAAFVEAMDSGAAQRWRGRRATGVVTPQSYALANLKADPNTRLMAARGDFDLAHVVETDLGLHVLTRNSNIRIGPDAKSKIAEVLPSGSGVDVVGGVRGKNWMLISTNNVVRGYVFGDLLIKAPGSELELAGGPMRKPVLCRNFSQQINTNSGRYEWTGAACNDGTGWRLAREPAPVENAPTELLEF